MTNLGHVELSRALLFFGLPVLQTGLFVSATIFLRRYSERKRTAKIIFWGCALLAVTGCALFFGPWLASQLLGLPLIGFVIAGGFLWNSIKLRPPVLGVFGTLVSGFLMIVCGGFVAMGALMGVALKVWIAPPTKAEVIALVNQTGIEHLRADAAVLNVKTTKDDWEIAKAKWPESFKLFKPVLLRVYPDGEPQSNVFQIFALKEFDSEIIVEVIPAGSDAQLEVGRLFPESPDGSWREKIADGVYWYSTLGPN